MIHMMYAHAFFELHSSYVSYLIVSAGTDLAGAILAGAILAGAIMAGAVSGSSRDQIIIY